MSLQFDLMDFERRNLIASATRHVRADKLGLSEDGTAELSAARAIKG